MNVLGAIDKLYFEYDLNPEDIISHIRHNQLTENETVTDRPVLWYMDSTMSVAIYEDTLEFLTPNEIENLL